MSHVADSKFEVYRIGQSSMLANEIRTAIVRELQRAEKLCLAPLKDREKTIHEIRKSFKRARAAFRLIRDETGYAAYYRENSCIREHHRKLSHIRELNVLNHTMGNIHDRYPGLFSEILYDDIMELIAEDSRQAAYRIKKEQVLQQIGKALDDPLDRIKFYPMNAEGFNPVKKGLERTFRQGRERLKALFSDGADPEEIHDFRKRGKYLYYQMEMLRPVFPKVMKAYARTLEQLTDLLGLYHDLYRAQVLIPELFKGKRYPGRSISTLFSLFNEEKKRLIQKARVHSSNVYVEEPSMFVNRMHSYWNIYIENKTES